VHSLPTRTRLGRITPHADTIAALMEGSKTPFTGILAISFRGASANHRLAPSVSFAVALGCGAWLSLRGIALPLIEPMVASLVEIFHEA
jgi:hypothetical protein